MEFLYFYVNAESPSWTDSPSSRTAPADVDRTCPANPTISNKATQDVNNENLPLDLVSTASNSPTSLNFTSPTATSTPPNSKTSPPPIRTLTRRASHQSTPSTSQPSSTSTSPQSTSRSPTTRRTPAAAHTHVIQQVSSSINHQNIPQIQRKESATLRPPSDTPMPGLETPKKVQQVREYPKTPRKALQPLNLQSGTRRPSQISGPPPVTVVREGSGHRRTPSGRDLREVQPTGLGRQRAQSQLSIDLSPGDVNVNSGSIRPTSMVLTEAASSMNATRPGHKRSQSSLDIRYSHVQPLNVSRSSPPHIPGSVRSPTAQSFPPIPEISHPEVPKTPFIRPLVAIGQTGKPPVVQTRTKEEKTEILRGMMSNVDALLEGMSRVGIWGLA